MLSASRYSGFRIFARSTDARLIVKIKSSLRTKLMNSTLRTREGNRKKARITARVRASIRISRGGYNDGATDVIGHLTRSRLIKKKELKKEGGKKYIKKSKKDV